MTPSDAAGLALLARHDRRLVAAILRALTHRQTAEDLEALPARLPDESVLAWACRCRHPDFEDHAKRLRREAEAQLARADAFGITALAFSDPRYPPLVAEVADPPPMLWLRGMTEVLTSATIGIVGSRAATPYALETTKRLAMDLAAAGIVVVSGLARGVDGAAHRGALAAGGRTVGVLGCGVDRTYPAEHRDLASAMAQTGAVVSEFPPGVPPLPHHFPMRNRIISGLSSAVVVVEAPEKSGSLITAAAAADQGRDVLVVPGQVTGGRNRGGHLLIRDGARIVESADDILQELGIGRVGGPVAGPVAARVGPHEFTVDELAAESGELPNVVLARLLEMELAGEIQRIGGGRFARVLT
jgi:DNA processing protein